jgi:hypothetical protein|tara:strand:- start:259 stop:975 length:717 start_codon:yes stop_codon:yes gene_type:complete
MINVCLLGYGNWGRTVLKSLNQIKIIKKITVIKNRKDKSKIPYNTDWAFVTVSTVNHFLVVKNLLNKGINVFCEKPLTNYIKNDLELYKIAKQKKCKLYVSDLENYKKIKIYPKNENFITRKKYSNIKNDIVNRLVYHDFTYLFKFLKNTKKIRLKIIKKKVGLLSFSMKFDDKKFQFIYSLNSKIKKHTFNDISLISKTNNLKDLINKIIINKVDFNENRKISLFSNRLTQKINMKK